MGFKTLIKILLSYNSFQNNSHYDITIERKNVTIFAYIILAK
jgi:hypothetical protein